MGMPNRGAQSLAISTVFLSIATVTVVLRLITRFCIVRNAGLEDYLIALSMVCSIGLVICVGIQARFGMGQHVWNLTEADMMSSGKAFWASLIVYYLSLGLTKSSILMQYLRVFPTKPFQVACYSVLAVVVCYTFWTVFGSIFACIPIRAFWTKEAARCIDQFVMWFTNAAINIVTDFAIVLLPMPVIKNLNLAKRQKFALMGVFAIGGCVCIISIMRLHSLIAISNSQDTTYDNPPAATWSSVESNVGIICSCLPTLRPLISRCFPRLFPSYHRYFTDGGNTSRMPATPLRRVFLRSGKGESGLGASQHDRSAAGAESDRRGKWDEETWRGVKVDTVIEVQVERTSGDAAHGQERRHGSTDTLVFGERAGSK